MSFFGEDNAAYDRWCEEQAAFEYDRWAEEMVKAVRAYEEQVKKRSESTCMQPTRAEVPSFDRESEAAGVMMLPIPAAGILAKVEGIEATFWHVDDVEWTEVQRQRNADGSVSVPSTGVSAAAA